MIKKQITRHQEKKGKVIIVRQNPSAPNPIPNTSVKNLVARRSPSVAKPHAEYSLKEFEMWADPITKAAAEEVAAFMEEKDVYILNTDVGDMKKDQSKEQEIQTKESKKLLLKLSNMNIRSSYVGTEETWPRKGQTKFYVEPVLEWPRG